MGHTPPFLGADAPEDVPLISVVVPTHNRSDLLPGLVWSLERQVGAPPFEVVIVDDASSDSTSELVARLSSSSRVVIRLERLPRNLGPAAARNIGWRRAKGLFIAFTDDDCVPQPGWLAALVAGLEHADVVQGVTLPDPGRFECWGPFSHTVEIKTPKGFFETCNIAYRRSCLEELGGFDDSFPNPYGEDTDLGWRAKGAGSVITFVPGAIVHHAVTDSSLIAHLRTVRRREGIVHLIALHPEVRAIFPGRWYEHRSHPAALLLAVSVASAVAWPGSSVVPLSVIPATMLYASRVRRERRIPRRRQIPAVVVQSLLADGFAVFVLARASIKYRTLFL